MGAKGAVEIIFKGKDVEQKTIEYTDRYIYIYFFLSFSFFFHFPFVWAFDVWY